MRVIERMSRIGAAGLTEDESLRQGTLILASLLIAVVSTVWVGIYLAYGLVRSAAISATYQVVTVVGLLILARTHDFARFRRVQFVLFLVLPGLLQVSLGGLVASSGIVLWALVVPLAALALAGLRRSVPWLLAYVVEVALLAVFDSRISQAPPELPGGLITAFFVLNVGGMTTCAYLMLGYFVEQRERVRQALEIEQERSEHLLLNVLPEAIAQRLKAGAGVIAEHYDDVSVLFADLVGFTEQTQLMEPEDLVTVLDRIFTAFDRVVDREGVEKIKTIGDAYMVAGGPPDRRPDHLVAIVRVALSMREDIWRLAQQQGAAWLQVRIGIATGPAVAGVIGRRKFIYDLWGDTVNTASRMESHGLPGQIHVTEAVAHAIAPHFSVRRRGIVDVKGKGPMRTFLVEAPPETPE